jgi:WD40 repeat protein
MTIPQGVRACACSPRGHVLVSGSDGSLTLWDAGEQRVVKVPARTGPILSCDVSDDRALLTGSEDHLVCLWNERGELQHRLEGHKAAVTGCRFASRPDRAVSCSRDRTIKLWDLATGRCLETFHAQAPLVSLALSRGTPNIAAVEETGRVLIVFSPELAQRQVEE